jgi:ribosome production factor 2
MKKPDAVTYTRKNKIIPFEDATSVEFFSAKNDCSLFALVSHTKKRPQNLVIGRLFDHHLLDMLEVGVSSYESIASFKAAIQPAVGNKPCIIFKGSEFETDAKYKLLKEMWMDMLHGRSTEKVNLANLDHVIVITAISDGTVAFRHYAIRLKKSGSSVGILLCVHECVCRCTRMSECAYMRA